MENETSHIRAETVGPGWNNSCLGNVGLVSSLAAYENMMPAPEKCGRISGSDRYTGRVYISCIY